MRSIKVGFNYSALAKHMQSGEEFAAKLVSNSNYLFSLFLGVYSDKASLVVL